MATLIALLAATCASLALGAVHVPLGDVIDTLLGKQVPEASKQIVEVLRLPRTVEAIVVGAALGVAGACLQGALNNPLASPDVIGVTGGAGFGAMLIILLYPSSLTLLPVSALAGAALLTGADTLARTIAAPVEMPVGPFLVLLGVPLFLWLLRKAV